MDGIQKESGQPQSAPSSGAMSGSGAPGLSTRNPAASADKAVRINPRRPRGTGRFSGLGLQGKLILSFSSLLLAAMSLASWVVVTRSSHTVADILGEQTRQIAQTVAMAASPGYEDASGAELNQLGRELLRNRNVVLVIFTDAAGRPTATFCRDANFDPNAETGPWRSGTQHLMQVKARKSTTLGHYLQVTAPVFDLRRAGRGVSINYSAFEEETAADTRLLGYATVGLSIDQESAQIQRVSVLGIGAGCIIFIASLPLASGLIHRIFLPIRQLVYATHRIAAGDYEAHVATNRPDEIGRLAESFNGMVDRIREHKKQLQIANDELANANRDLEQKVNQRTRELQASNSRLSSEIAEKEDFLRAVSHDLNAPLRNISGMATMLLMKYRERFDEDVIHRLERIRKNVEVETDLIAELLELSRIKTRRQKTEAIDMNVLVEEVAGVFDDDLGQRKIALSVETPLPPLLAEKARMRQVFQNLIDNAIKYMGDTPGKEKAIRISHRMVEDGVEFAVADTGVGIDAEDLTKVFYVFRRGKNSAEVKVPGKGVGLASVKSIVETYDGRIWVESTVGQGSTFRFTVPRKHVAPAPPAAEGNQTPQVTAEDGPDGRPQGRAAA